MAQTLRVALAGNPNAGKTTIFNALTGARQHVGNWPGVTVEKKEGSVKLNGQELHIIDLPGTYSLTAYSLEEIIARNFIVESAPDVVIDVVDASNLERNLYLAVQILEMGVKLVIALNMMDVAEGRGIAIDVKGLSEMLGVPVIPTNGKRGVGIQDLVAEAVRVSKAPRSEVERHVVSYGTEVEEEIDNIRQLLDDGKTSYQGLSNRWVAAKLLEGDPEITSRIGNEPLGEEILKQVDKSREHLESVFDDPPEILLADWRYGFVSGAVKRAVSVEPGDRVHLSETIDKVLTNRLLGPTILLVTLYAVYAFVFQGSEPLVGLFERFFGILGEWVTAVLPDGLLQSLIVSGIIDGVGGVLGFTPLIAFMFFAIAILEDTGYMARVAFMLDRVLRGFGLHGASMLALMVSGGLAGGCAVPGIMATRTMKEPKERLVTILVAPLMNCGAKLPVYALLIGAFFPGQKAPMMFLLTLISWSMALLAGKLIRSTVLSGPSAPFVLELPPYRMPTLKGLLLHTWERTWMYVKKAGTVILAISIVLWAMMTFPGMPDDEAARFDKARSSAVEEFLAAPGVASYFDSVDDFRRFQSQYSATGKKDARKPSSENAKWAALAEAIRKGDEQPGDPGTTVGKVAQRYGELQKNLTQINRNAEVTALQHTIGGRMGLALEKVFSPIGFDWRTCIALVGGFAAKEVVVSTLGTAYSLGAQDPEDVASLEERLKREPGWNPLMAFTLILFVMLYAPCFVTLVVIRRETGTWGWTLFAMVYTTALAYAVALVVKNAGVFLGLGV